MCTPGRTRYISSKSRSISSRDNKSPHISKELEPFPDIKCLDKIRIFHDELSKAYSPRDQFPKFAWRSCYLPQGIRRWSLGTLKKNLLIGDMIKREISGDDLWNSDPIVSAVWTFVGLCGLTEVDDLSGLLAHFVSRAGIGDPYRVVFELPELPSQKIDSLPCHAGSCTEVMVLVVGMEMTEAGGRGLRGLEPVELGVVTGASGNEGGGQLVGEGLRVRAVTTKG